MKPLSRKDEHTTEHEIFFINHIGKFSTSKLSAIDCLTGYIKGLGERSNWGDIKKKAVTQRAKARLVELKSI